MLLTEAVSMFIDSRKLGVDGARKKATPKTVRAYEYNLKAFTDWLLSADKPKMKFEDLTKNDIRSFASFIDDNKDWSFATKLQILRGLRAFLRWAEEDEDLKDEAVKKNLKKFLPTIAKTPRRQDIPQNKELKNFKGYFRTELVGGFRDYVMFCLMLDTGCRVGEVRKLRINEMRLDEKVLIVNGKSGPRPVAVTKEMVSLLKAWMKKRKMFKHAADSEFVFASKYGPEELGEEAFTKRMWKIRKEHPDLPRITPHSLRHAFATNFLKKGGDMEKARVMMGHSSYAMLQNYLHLAKVGGDSMQKELERVSLLKEM